MAVKSIHDLFLHTLKDVYSAEKQILKQLPKMAKVAKSADLKHAFESDREETEHQIKRLEAIRLALRTSNRLPSIPVICPPASSTSSAPAATSQGFRRSSQNPSMRPAAT